LPLFSAFRCRVLVAVVSSSGLLLLGATAASAAPSPGQAEAASGPELTYRIGPGDVLDVFVWKEPELTTTVTVRFDGRITVPLLGDILAAGREPQVLAGEVAERLRQFVDAPHVTIGISQASARVYVVGRVATPGAFPFTGPMTALQALALAGGLVEFAKSDSIVIIREQDESPVSIRVDYDRLKNGQELEQNRHLAPGDTIIVP